MFKREHHQRIQQLLTALRVDTLTDVHVMFAGGTRIVLDLDEYRESADVDFLCNADGYAALRSRVMSSGYEALFRADSGSNMCFPREIRADRYGIRFPVWVDAVPIKVEFVLEGRISLESPETPRWSAVPCLSRADCVAEKLLANSDRWLDRSVQSRDLIDLSVMRIAWETVFQAAIATAEQAYRDSVLTDLRRAVVAFADKPEWRDACYRGLAVDRLDLVFDGLTLLGGELGIPAINPSAEEDHALFRREHDLRG